MLIELGAIASFLGLLFLVGWKLMILANRDNYENPPYSPWFSLLTLIGMFVCWGIFVLVYFSSFKDSTIITRADTADILISNSNYFVLTGFMPVINGLFAVGAALGFIEFVLLVSLKVFGIANAKYSTV